MTILNHNNALIAVGSVITARSLVRELVTKQKPHLKVDITPISHAAKLRKITLPTLHFLKTKMTGLTLHSTADLEDGSPSTFKRGMKLKYWIISISQKQL